MATIINSAKANKIIDWLSSNPIIKKSVIAEIIGTDASYFTKMCRRERTFDESLVNPVIAVIKKYGYK